MPININNLAGTNTGSTKTRGTEESAKVSNNSAAETGTASSSDEVKISSEAQVMKKLESEIKAMPDIDQGKINRIKDALRSGEYQINYDRLATAIEKFESEL